MKPQLYSGVWLPVSTIPSCEVRGKEYLLPAYPSPWSDPMPFPHPVITINECKARWFCCVYLLCNVLPSINRQDNELNPQWTLFVFIWCLIMWHALANHITLPNKINFCEDGNFLWFSALLFFQTIYFSQFEFFSKICFKKFTWQYSYWCVFTTTD